MGGPEGPGDTEPLNSHVSSLPVVDTSPLPAVQVFPPLSGAIDPALPKEKITAALRKLPREAVLILLRTPHPHRPSLLLDQQLDSGPSSFLG